MLHGLCSFGATLKIAKVTELYWIPQHPLNTLDKINFQTICQSFLPQNLPTTVQSCKFSYFFFFCCCRRLLCLDETTATKTAKATNPTIQSTMNSTMSAPTSAVTLIPDDVSEHSGSPKLPGLTGQLASTVMAARPDVMVGLLLTQACA